MDVDGQKFRWRCVDAARYVVALAVTALIVAVMAHAIRVLLRPDFLILRVEKSFVTVERNGRTSNMSFSLSFEVANPSLQVAIFYEGVKAYLYGRANNASEAAYFATIPVNDISLKQQSTEFEYLRAYPFFSYPNLTWEGEEILKPYFDLFNSTDGNKGIPDGVVVLNGTLTVGLYSWSNRTARAATYYCWPVGIGTASSENPVGDAECMDNPPTPQAILPDS